MEHSQAIPYLREIVIILAAAGVLVPLFHRLHISPVLGYLIAGFAVGPYGLGSITQPQLDFLSHVTIRSPEDVARLGEFGVVFLLFMIGLELSPARLMSMRKLVFGLGSLQVLFTAAIIGPVAYLFGNSLAASVVLAFCLALSSTAVVMQILMDRRKLGTPLGRACFSILLLQDLAVVPILILLGIFAGGATGEIGAAVMTALLKAGAAIGIILLAGHYALSPLFRIAGSASGAEPFMAVTLLTVIVTAAITGMAGLSMALGAFLAGLLLAETEYRHAIEVYMEPFKGLLLGLFFMTVGMGMDPSMVKENVTWLCLSVVGLMMIKAGVIAPFARLFGLTWGHALEAGLLLGQAGEFAFVIVGSAMTLKLLPAETGQFMLIVTSLSMMLTPLTAYGARKVRLYVDRRNSGISETAPSEIPELHGHVIVAGVGRVGRSIARVLDAEAIPYVSIDNNTAVVAEKRKAGKEVFYGDASRYELLKQFAPEKAAAIVLTMDDARDAATAIENIRRYWPDVPVFARARDKRVARLLHKAGAAGVVAETVETSLHLIGYLLKGVGVDADVILRRLEMERDHAWSGITEP
jgi:monovalent cation:proton antiporter-2 (CPA2) family protein